MDAEALLDTRAKPRAHTGRYGSTSSSNHRLLPADGGESH
ncbi:MAG: hypothetical protein QOE94_478 [Mycobacterium sp.]|jgi:hypothetical protein|nr:hypothetical protein [Mycobacterium sp.]